jgi:catalase-peroxidase
MTTFRSTDFQGGCNGARIRFDPQLSWPINAGLRDVLDKLVGPLYAKFRFNMTFADLIILAANTALEISTGRIIPFQGTLHRSISLGC